jgi:putative addiction module component (TIGR02574 family)
MSIDEVRAAALALGPEDRGILARDLLASLDNDASEDDAEWGAELQRRYDEYVRGDVVGISGEESIRQARMALEAARQMIPS